MASMWVDIDLTDVDDDELIDELKARGFNVLEESETTGSEALERIYHLRRQGKPFDTELDSYICHILGKVI